MFVRSFDGDHDGNVYYYPLGVPTIATVGKPLEEQTYFEFVHYDFHKVLIVIRNGSEEHLVTMRNIAADEGITTLVDSGDRILKVGFICGECDSEAIPNLWPFGAVRMMY